MCWIYNQLGKSVLKVIPTCSVWEIRAKYRSENNKYFSFTKYNEVKEGFWKNIDKIPFQLLCNVHDMIMINEQYRTIVNSGP